MKFNDIIRAAMQETGTTQQKLGDMLGVRQNAIANTLARPGVTLTNFAHIMDALGYDVVIQPRNGKGSKMVLTNE